LQRQHSLAPTLSSSNLSLDFDADGLCIVYGICALPRTIIEFFVSQVGEQLPRGIQRQHSLMPFSSLDGDVSLLLQIFTSFLGFISDTCISSRFCHFSLHNSITYVCFHILLQYDGELTLGPMSRSTSLDPSLEPPSIDRQSSLDPIIERNYSVGLVWNRGESTAFDNFMTLNRLESLDFLSDPLDDDESAEKQDFETFRGFGLHGQR
jgi:hypothetical protein